MLCFLFSLFPFFRMSPRDGGVEEPDATTDDYDNPEGAYYYVEAAYDQE